MAESSREAYFTLLMSDAYLPGALVLARSLRDNGTSKELAAMVTLDSVSSSTIDDLRTCYDHIIPVDRIVNRAPANLYLMDRPDLASTFTKINLWRQTQFSHIVYIDSDIVALRAPDELFNLPYTFAAAPDVGWPDCFNSGVLSLKPDMGDFYALSALAQRGISFDGADQGLLNMHFRDWHRLSFTYNCTPNANYQYVPAYRHFQSSISLVHFIGRDKPWFMGRRHGVGNGVYEELAARWWATYDRHYKSGGSTDETGSKATTVQKYVFGEPQTPAVNLTRPEDQEQADTEASLTEKSDPVKPTPTVEQRRYSTDWDPLHHPPPLGSKPEAANFPSNIYTMSQDPHLFQPPKTPSPPRGMYYSIPDSSNAGQPKSIFPWEGKAPKPARVFAEDTSPPAPEPGAAPTAVAESSSSHSSEYVEPNPASPTAAESFSTYKRLNAWDDMPEIERYVASLPQNRRSQVQFPSKTPDPSSADEPLTSPTAESPTSSRRHRPSLKLTDFPTEIERPSLPVTPAPVHRPSLWSSGSNSSERDPAIGVLPTAQGVPQQSDWDPVAKLVELQRRQAEVLEKGAPEVTEAVKIPARKVPESSVGRQTTAGASAGTGASGSGSAVPVTHITPPAAPAAASSPLTTS